MKNVYVYVLIIRHKSVNSSTLCVQDKQTATEKTQSSLMLNPP